VRREMTEMQTVEVRFRGEKLATATTEDGAYTTLYRTPRGNYFVHYDMGEAGAYLATGLSAVVSRGHLQEGISEGGVRRHWPELAEAAGLAQLHDPYRYAATEELRREHGMMD
jgi:hypothetical protein